MGTQLLNMFSTPIGSRRDQQPAHLNMRNKLVIVMVGLPARGKSYVTKKLCRYLNWLHHETKIFNVGDRRRFIAGSAHHASASDAHTAIDTKFPDQSANFFDPNNREAGKLRERLALETLDDLLTYLMDNHGSVAIFDATNSTIERRELLVSQIRKKAGPDLSIMFLESQCFDETILEENLRLKLSGPDYRTEDPVLALSDFSKRVKMYEKKYVPLGKYEETHGYSFCQMIDVGRKFVMHNIRGYLPTQTVHYLQHFNLFPRQIWLSRHGESIDDAAGRIGGDSNLSLLGIKYAKALTDFIEHQRKVWIDETFDPDHAKRSFQPDNAEGMHAQSFHVWTSNMRRSSQTAQFFDTSNYEVESLRMLDELNAGILEGFTRNEVKEFYSDWLKEREGDKLRCRYPGTGGEGYLDVTNRLRSVILEVERLTDHVLLISGLAVTRVLLAYFRGLQRDEITELHAPLGTIYKLEPKPYGVQYTEYVYNTETNWFTCNR